MNVMQYAMTEEALYRNMASELGYKPFTTFFTDLSIAEFYGVEAIRETFDRIKKTWIGHYKYWTEFVLCVNWKSWEMSDKGDFELCNLYAELYGEARRLFYNKYENDVDACRYFYQVTD